MYEEIKARINLIEEEMLEHIQHLKRANRVGVIAVVVSAIALVMTIAIHVLS